MKNLPQSRKGRKEGTNNKVILCVLCAFAADVNTVKHGQENIR
jgi:hypothetical protein